MVVLILNNTLSLFTIRTLHDVLQVVSKFLKNLEKYADINEEEIHFYNKLLNNEFYIKCIHSTILLSLSSKTVVVFIDAYRE